MSLSDQQFSFGKDCVQLGLFIITSGWKFTIGEVWRPEEMQEIYIEQGKSWTPNSLHLHRLAIDINFFAPDREGWAWVGEWPVATQVAAIMPFGDFWESLSEKNEWGGRWSEPDCPHFQRNRI